MKGRTIAIGTLSDRAYAHALLVNGHLEDLIVISTTEHHLPGDIVNARITRKLSNSGAFCTFQVKAEGYLRDAKSVREGDRVLVQVVNRPEPGKAAPVTTRLLFKGPRLILTPDAPGINVSRRIGNAEERERLQAIVAGATAFNDNPEMGVIIRTSARGEGQAQLERELEHLVEWHDKMRLSDDGPDTGTEPSRRGPNVDWLHPMPDDMIVTPEIARSYRTNGCGPDPFWGDDQLVARLQEAQNPLTEAGVIDGIDNLRSPQVNLDGAASLTVEATRALVAIDVNTGADFSAAAGLKTNLLAAQEIPRQLRLRGLGGQIVVDFAPMEKRHRKTLETRLLKALRDDPVETALLGWTKLGLLELQRKRERRPISELI